MGIVEAVAGEISDMLENDSDDVIVKTIIELAHNLGLRVIAEGVENRATLDRLGVLGCDMVQGHFTGVPMPGIEFLELLHNNYPKSA